MAPLCRELYKPPIFFSLFKPLFLDLLKLGLNLKCELFMLCVFICQVSSHLYSLADMLKLRSQLRQCFSSVLGAKRRELHRFDGFTSLVASTSVQPVHLEVLRNAKL